MTEDVKPEVIKKTQESLGKFIRKPTLSEKLLKKPPFRFLHDICTSVMKETGFLEDVLSAPEDKIENIKDKEGKIVFLQKLIAAVEAANGIKLTVRPNKIVAGLEATKTNELLQGLAKALENKVENKASKSQLNKTKTKKTSKEIKEEPPDKKKTSTSKTSKKVVENGIEDQKTPRSPKKKHSSKKIEESEPVIEEKKEKPKEQKVEEKPRKEKPNTSGAGESRDVPNVDYIKVNGADGQGDQPSDVKEEVLQEEIKKIHSGKHKHRRPSIHRAAEPADPPESTQTDQNDLVPEKTIGDVNRTEDSLKEQVKSTLSPTKQADFIKKETPPVKETPLISRPRTAIRPTTARPASARPAAPRIRDKGEIAVVEEVIKPVIGKVQVIEDKDTKEVEDENLISMETTNDIILEEELAPILPPTTTLPDQEHGHLVEQILEAQRELEDDSRFVDQKSTGRTEIEWESSKSKEATNREIEKLRSNIQLLTRSVNPLGKLLDFFQEDVEIIQKELEVWKEKNSNLSLQIAQEKSITDQMAEPLKIHLKELQQSIDEQLEQISVAKANILRNNDKIHKLLTGV